jgi:hypothetical protein
MNAYSEQLRDVRWQKKRLEILSARGWKCEDCGTEVAGLNVHHPSYAQGWAPWDYPDWHYIVLCEPCHDMRHRMQRSIHLWFGQLRGQQAIYAAMEDIRRIVLTLGPTDGKLREDFGDE